MKKIITSFLMAILAIGAWAQDNTEPSTTPEVVFDFVNNDNFKACTVTNSPSASLSYSSYSGGSIYAYVSSPSNYTSYNYTIVSPEQELQGSNQYALYVTPSIYSGYDGKKSYEVKVLFGQGDDLAQYDLLGNCDVVESSYNGIHKEFTFGVENTDNYKIAIQVEGKGVTPKFSELKLVKIGATQVPLAVSDFTVVPDSEGKNEATISFTLPSKTESFADLENIKYTVSRIVLKSGDDNEAVKIKDKVEGTPGENIEFVDQVPENNANYSYTVFVTNGNEDSKKVTGQAYIGLDIPTAPANFELNVQEGGFVITWDAPTEGVNGISLSPEKLIYTLTRIFDGTETVIEESLSNVTTYTDEFTYTGLHNIQYSIKAKYTANGEFSEEVKTQKINIGNVPLPYSYSFANGEIDSSWTNVCLFPTSDYASNKWQGKEKDPQAFFLNAQTQERVYVDVNPYDEDGGLAMYSTYSHNYSARLISPSILFEAGQKPVLTFARFVNFADSQDALKIQISVDGGDWQDVDGAEYFNGLAEENKWVEEAVDFSSYLSDGDKEFRIAFLTVNTASGTHKPIYIDAIRIFSKLENDLAIDAFTVSEKAHAGDKIVISVTVANNGSYEVSAEDYTVEIEHDFAHEITITDLKPIPSLGSVTYQVTIPVHSLHLYGKEGFEFTAKVSFVDDQTQDEAPDNNESETQVVEASYSAGKGVEITESTFDTEGNYYIYWNPAKDLEYVPVNISESFEDFEDDFTGPFNGWVTIDLDKKNYGNYYTTSGSQFNVVESPTSPTGVRNNMDGHNVLGLTISANSTQDDWIISPKLDCKEGSTMDLDFLFGVRNNNSYYVNYGIEILYTTEDSYDETKPAEAFTKVVTTATYGSSDKVVPHDETLHRVKFEGIPAEAKYVAIHFNAKSTSTAYWMAMWVDDIHLTEVESNPLLGYHVYSLEVGGRLNEELIDADATEFKFKPQVAEETEEPQSVKHRAASLATGEPLVFVTAVYADGEAKAENVWNYADESLTGIENVAVEDAEGKVEYFNLQGLKVSGENLTPGIYIIRTGNTTQKVLVK